MRKIWSNIKRFISACLMAFLTSVSVSNAQEVKCIHGKYKSLERPKVICTFVGNDSLYIDDAKSGCGLTAFEIIFVGYNFKYMGDEYVAFETEDVNGKERVNIVSLYIQHFNKPKMKKYLYLTLYRNEKDIHGMLFKKIDSNP